MSQRMELIRSQCGQIKITSWRFADASERTEALK
jgi:hypothetical protein